MTTITLPAEIPHEALRQALANLGLVIDGRVQSDGSHRAIWAEDALRERYARQPCAAQGCTNPPAARVGGQLYCAAHALPALRQEGAL